MCYYNSKWHQVVRSPDGESRGLPLGKLSIQRAAAMVTIIIMIMIVIIIVIIKSPNQHRRYCDLNFMNQVLEMYYTHFPIYNPYLDQVDPEF